MPRRINMLPLVCACLLLGACGVMSTHEAYQLDSGELRVAAEQSRQLHEARSREQPDATTKADIERLQDAVWQFERKVIRTAVQFEQNDDWQAAERLLRQAALRLPHSIILLSAERQFHERRRLEEEAIRTEMVIHEAEQLVKNHDAYQRLQRVRSGGLFTWLEVRRFESRCRRAAQDLQQYAQLAIANEDYYLARRGLLLAQRLTPADDSITGQLAVADRAIDDMNRPAAGKGMAAHRVAPAKTLVNEFQQTLAAGQLPAARESLQQLQKKFPQHQGLPKLRSQLKAREVVRVQAAIEEGKELYSQGKVQEALSVWREASKLDPDNLELRSGIARAERVLQNLRALSARDS